MEYNCVYRPLEMNCDLLNYMEYNCVYRPLEMKL